MSIQGFSANPPTIYDMYPGDTFFTSETSFPIVIFLYDDTGITENTIKFEYNNVRYDTNDPNVTWADPVLTFTHPIVGGNYAEGDHVIRLLDCQDQDVPKNQLENLPLLINFNIDTSAPTITDLFPDDGEQSVSTESNLEIHFSEEIDSDSVGNSIKIYDGNTEISKGTYSFQENNKILILNPELKEGKSYSIRIRTWAADKANSLKNLAGVLLTDDDNIPGDGYYIYTINMENSDKPVVIAYDPELTSATEDDMVLSIIFSKSMDFSSFENKVQVFDPLMVQQSIYLKQGKNDKTIDIALNNALMSGIIYEIYITNTVTDLLGLTLEDTGDDNAVDTNYEKYFTLNSPLPAVESTIPTNGATSVTTTSEITIKFNKKMDVSTVLPGNFTIVPTKALKGIQWTDLSTAVLEFDSEFLENIGYSITVNKNGLLDYYGKTFASDYTFTFTTGQGLAKVNSTTPVNGETGVLVGSTLQIEFNGTPENALKKSTWLTVVDQVTGNSIKGDVGVAGKIVTFRPQNSVGVYIDFDDYTYYKVIVNNVEFEDGSVYSGNYSFYFTTVDTNSPTVVAISPVSGSKLRDGESIYVYFSEKMDINSVEANIILNQAVKTFEWDSDGTRLEIIMNPVIYEKTLLEIGIGAKDLSGNGFAVKYIAEFTNLNVTNVVLVNSYPSAVDNSVVRSNFYCRLHFNIDFNPVDILSSVQILGQGTESSKVIGFDSYLVSAVDAKIITLYLTDTTKLSADKDYIIRVPAGTQFTDGIVSQQDIEISFKVNDETLLQGSVFRLSWLEESYFITVYDGHFNDDPTVPLFYAQNESGGLRSISLQSKLINNRKIYYGYFERNKDNQKILVVKGKYTEEMRLY